MSCDDKKYILVPLQGVPGPQGEQGPPGPPGSGIELPIPASDISVINPGFTDQQDLNNFLLYSPLTISSFTTPVNVYEIGQIVTSLTFNWILSRDPVSQTLTGPEITPPTLTIAQRSVTLVVTDLQGVSPNDSFAYILQTIDDRSAIAQAQRNVSFYNGVFYGDALIPGVLDSNFINSLTKNLQSGKGRTWTSNAAGGQYSWYCWRKTLGTVIFHAGGFEGGFESPVTVSFTNDSGYVEDYYVARSTNLDIGPVNIIAT